MFFSASILANSTTAGSQGGMDLSTKGSAQIIQGSVGVIQGGGSLVIESVRTVGNFTYLTLRSAKKASTVVLKMSTQTVGAT